MRKYYKQKRNKPYPDKPEPDNPNIPDNPLLLHRNREAIGFIPLENVFFEKMIKSQKKHI